MRDLATYLVTIADPSRGDYRLNEALASACALARLVLACDAAKTSTRQSRAEQSPLGAYELDDILTRLRAFAVRLLDDDDHDCDLTEELGVACEMATLFQALDAVLSSGAPGPILWRP
jgi:hypothetical protein